jgi:methyltransferase-like protein
MKTRKVNILEEMAKRVYNDISTEQISGLNKGKPMMNGIEISDHIKDYLNYYLSAEEQAKLITENTYCHDNEEMNKMVIYIAIEMVGKNVSQALENAVDKHFVGNSPFPPMKNLQLSIIEKFLKSTRG